MKYPTSAALALAAALSFTPGYARTFRIDAYDVRPIQPPAVFSAGAAKVDITPPPGFPFGGHGPAGSIAIGYWSRLYARAYYFKPAKGHPFAFVTTDLWAMPSGLTKKVLQLTNAQDVPLPPDRLVLAATHTHHSPGSFMTSQVHTDLASFEGGHDPELFKWLAGRIADAIIEAAQGAQPATLSLYQDALCTVQVNRSLEPFAQNPDAANIQRMRNDACKAPATTLARESASNPTLRVLAITTKASPPAPIGLLIFYAVHPTVLPDRSPLYSADLFAAATAQIESHFKLADQSVIAGIFNGAEGDLVPRKIDRDLDEVVELGRLIGANVLQLLKKPPVATQPEPQVYSSRLLVPTRMRGFADKPMGGVAVLGGGEHDRSQYHPDGWRDGIISNKEKIKGQGPKEPGFERRVPFPFIGGLLPVRRLVSLVIVHEHHFPQELPISLHIIPGLLTFAALPVETTTTMGVRLTNAVHDTLVNDHSYPQTIDQPVQIIGLANEYYSYLTTPQEYALQHYEGASTLLGANEGPVLQQQLVSIKPTLVSAKLHEDAASFTVGTKDFGPAYLTKRILGDEQNDISPDFELEEVVPKRLEFREAQIPRFEWTEHCTGLNCPADWSPDLRSIELRYAGSHKIAERETDLRFVAVLKRAAVRTRPVPTRRWVAFWIPPKHPDLHQRYYFRIKPADSPTPICSLPFTLATLPTLNGILPMPIAPAACP